MRHDVPRSARLLLSCVVLLMSPVALAAAHGTGDFNGDGNADILQRNLHSGAWRYHTLVDDVPETHALALESNPVWRFVAIGDFDGNGFDDVLLRRYDTLEAVYYAVSANNSVVRRSLPGMTVNPRYDVLGAGDFDGDGADEVLLRRNLDYGEWIYYDIAGSQATLRRRLIMTQNLEWDFVATGDMNGDGRDDVLARHPERGNWIAYLMDGTARAVLSRPRMTKNLLFSPHALADITGDGKADPLLRNETTLEWIYYATGSRPSGGPHVSMRLHRGLGMTRNKHWTVAALGDFDGDGRATPMLRHRLYGGWVLYDIEGATSNIVRFPGLSTQRVWVASGRLTQDNPPVLSRVEFLQGPPTYRKDYRTGKTIGPINASRAESGEALEPWVWGGNFFEGPGVPVWFEESQGFVTSVWQRRMVVAVEATHAYRAPYPTMTVELLSAEGAAIPLDTVLLDVTEPDIRTGYRTEMVFDLPAEHHLPGGALIVRVHSEGATVEDRLPLFGETVTPLSVTWVPVKTDNFEPLGLDEDGYIDRVVPYLPVGPYRTRVAEPLVYERTGEEEDGMEFEHGGLLSQLLVRHAAQGCGYGDLFVAVYPYAEMTRAGIRLPALGNGAGRRAIVPSYSADAWDTPPTNGEIPIYAHEVGHTLDLLHAPCNDPSASLDPEYPYPDGGLGPARGWHPVFNRFIDRDSVEYDDGGRVHGYADLMGYCEVNFVGDYSYQRALMYLQAPHYAEWSREADACWTEDGEAATPERTLAVVGMVAPDGAATIVGTAPSALPPTAPAPAGTGDAWLLSLLDSGGGELYRQRVALEADVVHGHQPSLGRVWRARVPYAAGRGATVVLRDDSGAIRMRRLVEAIR